MKYLLLTLFLLGAIIAQAQPSTPAAPVAPYRYCALVLTDRYFNSPHRLYLDYGQGAPGAVADPEMIEMAKNIGQSSSVIDILNYLSRHGWELLSQATLQTNLQKSGLNERDYYLEHETRYLLRRRTP